MARRPSVGALQAGDESAWGWFCQEFNHSISAYARTRGVSDADDISGNVMEAVARSVHKFTGDHKAFRSWVFSIAHNYVVDDLRRRTRRPEILSEEIQEGLGAYEAELGSEVDPDLAAALQCLTADQKEAIFLRYVWGFSGKEVAINIRKSASATRVMLHRALKQVQTEFAKNAVLTQEEVLESKGERQISEHGDT